jgi:uncharacterized caspase-like protein
LYDANATRIQILDYLSNILPNRLGKNDQLVVYFAGHGQTESYKDSDGQISEEGYILPVDCNQDNYRGTAISMSAIHELSKKIKAKHIYYVFDSCYSGLGLKRSSGIEKTDGYINKITSNSAIQILTAGGKNELAGEEKGHGIFTRQLLIALDGKADMDHDGYITASEIGTYVKPEVSRKTENQQTPKFGWVSGEGDNVFFVNKFQ